MTTLALLLSAAEKLVRLNDDWVCRVESIDTSAATFEGGVAFINGYPAGEVIKWP